MKQTAEVIVAYLNPGGGGRAPHALIKCYARLTERAVPGSNTVPACPSFDRPKTPFVPRRVSVLYTHTHAHTNAIKRFKMISVKSTISIILGFMFSHLHGKDEFIDIFKNLA